MGIGKDNGYKIHILRTHHLPLTQRVFISTYKMFILILF